MSIPEEVLGACRDAVGAETSSPTPPPSPVGDPDRGSFVLHALGTGCGRRWRDDPMTIARATVEEMLALLAAGDFVGHEHRCVEVRSDFRDAGPVFAQLAAAQGVSRPVLLELRLVKYADILGAPEPTWVAAALVGLRAG
ncbi:MAG: hypothetical protein IT372_15405 [Polyangiaceae bacterium]|nr:hypothetical protein [Polyangiaceae bacterium]